MTDACKGGGDYPLLLSCKRCVLKQFPKITSQSVHRIFTVTGTHWENTKNDVKAAMDRCIGEGILTDFFKERYNEVIKVVELDYTFDRRLELTRDESWNEGHESGWKDGHESGWNEGHESGRNDIIIDMFKNGKSAQEIADFSGVPIEQICDVEQRIMKKP